MVSIAVSQIVEGLFGERGDLHVADVVLDAVLDGLHLDDVAHDRDLDRLVGAFAQDGQLDRRVDQAAHLLDRVVQGQAAHVLAVDLRNIVAGAHAGLGRRGVVDRRDHLDQLVLHGDLDAEAAELALGLDAHVLGRFGIEVGGMRIERGQHAVDGVLDQRLLVGRRHILAAHALEYVAEDRQLLVGLGARCVRGRAGHAIDHAHGGRAHQRTGKQKRNLTNHFLSFQTSSPTTMGPDRRVFRPCGTQCRVPGRYFHCLKPKRSPLRLHS